MEQIIAWVLVNLLTLGIFINPFAIGKPRVEYSVGSYVLGAILSIAQIYFLLKFLGII